MPSATSSAATPTPGVPHPDGRVDPMADIETIETELTLADYEQVERRTRPGLASRRSRATPRPPPSSPGSKPSERSSPSGGRPARVAVPEAAPEAARNLQALTTKPILYVANVDEGDAGAAAAGGRARALDRRRGGRGQRADRGGAGRARPRRSGGDAPLLRGPGLRPRPPRPRRLRAAGADHLLHRRRGQGSCRPAARRVAPPHGRRRERSTPRSRIHSSKRRRSAGRSWSSAAGTRQPGTGGCCGSRAATTSSRTAT